MSRYPDNDAKFAHVRALRLPLRHYAITSGGTLGIRGIRAIGDVDIIVDDQLWSELSARRPITRDRNFDRIVFGTTIEVFGPDSFLASRTIPPTVSEQIAAADFIAGLPFVCLEHILHLKRNVLLYDPTRTKRASDLRDIRIIQGLLRTRTVSRQPSRHSASLLKPAR